MSHVILMMGGDSTEREISLQSGGEVLSALQILGHTVEVFDPRDHDFARLTAAPQGSKIFIALHGRGGEDGCIQGLLNLLRLPYTGSGVLASALCMDKLRSKLLWQALALPTAKFIVLTPQSAWQAVVDQLGLPLFVKPSCEGSSFGISKVETLAQLPAAYGLAAQYGGDVIAEACLPGPEYTVGVVDGVALPSICIKTSQPFYNYEAKYVLADTRLCVPSGLSAEAEKNIGALATEMFRSVGGRGWGRVDFILDHDGAPSCLEVNTSPGMTSHSLVPTAAKAAGLSFPQLVDKILTTAAYDFEPNVPR